MFSHDQLVDYLNGFHGAQREAIYKSILDSNILEQAFSTPEGKMILNQAVENIASNVINIVATCSDKDPKEAATAIYPQCMEISLAHKLLVAWARILTDGDKHKKKIREKKNAR